MQLALANGAMGCCLMPVAGVPLASLRSDVLAAKLRPGALRRFTPAVVRHAADFPAVRAFTAHRGTHFAHCVRAVRTTAMRMTTKCAARTAAKAVLLGVVEAHRSPPEHSFAGGCSVIAATKTRHATSSRQVVSGGSDLWGAEQASPGHKQSSGLFVPGEQQGLWPGAACKTSPAVGARSAFRELTRCGCPNGESEANTVSSAARPLGEQRRGVGGVPHDRTSVSARRIPAAATRALPAEAPAGESPLRARTGPLYMAKMSSVTARSQ